VKLLAILAALALSCAEPRVPVENVTERRLPKCEPQVFYRVEEREVRTRVVRPCLNHPPPAEPTLTGDESIDRHRRDEHLRRLSAWTHLAWEVCRR
jgi:hypothetical protein